MRSTISMGERDSGIFLIVKTIFISLRTAER